MAQIQQSITELELSIQKFFTNIASKSISSPHNSSSPQPTFSFQQAKLDSAHISILLTKLEQLLDHSQLTFAMDHSKSHLLKVDSDKVKNAGAYSEQFSQVMQNEVLEETNKEKKNLSIISQNAYNTMEQLRKLNDQLFVEFLEESESDGDVIMQ